MSEADNQAEIMLLGRGDTRLFRNHVAKGWTGEFVRKQGDLVILKNARQATFGLCVGSPDLVGWRSVEITPDMVGQTVAVFAAIEVKSETGRPTKEQANFCDVVRRAGGLAGIARSADQVRVILGKSE